MAKIEIDDTEYERLQRAMGLLTKLDGDPRTKPHLEAALKIQDPNLQTEADVAERMTKPVVEKFEAATAEIKGYFEKLTERDNAQAKAATEASITEAFTRLRGAGYTDEGIEKIKAIMVDRSVADPEAAAALFDKLNPPPAVADSNYSPPAWDLESVTGGQAGPSLKDWFENEDKAEAQAVAQTLNEIRLGKEA